MQQPPVRPMRSSTGVESTAIGMMPRREAALGDGSGGQQQAVAALAAVPTELWYASALQLHRPHFGETAEVKVIGRLPGERSCR
jgi:hypothetical protein